MKTGTHSERAHALLAPFVKWCEDNIATGPAGFYGAVQACEAAICAALEEVAAETWGEAAKAAKRYVNHGGVCTWGCGGTWENPHDKHCPGLMLVGAFENQGSIINADWRPAWMCANPSCQSFNLVEFRKRCWNCGWDRASLEARASETKRGSEK